ncbi:MAG: MerR family transcriptional regulator [Clostridiales bacterium]|nr:MerR family transcriptional regulator [Candidatus Cacconaster stercorequi]
MKTVHEVSKISGVSVRTLHHYDAIGLLKPTATTQAGYRLYDDDSLRRLQTILLFRELQFPLKEIKHIIEHPEFDQAEALRQQIKLLQLQRDQLDHLIALAREQLVQGVNTMDFSAFDKSDMSRYANEVKERWGNTAAYQESQKRNAEDQHDATSGLMEIFARFGEIRDTDPASPPVQALVKELQDYITAYYYTCTPEILCGLGTMYTEDERFRSNIDKAGGNGTAAFAAKAIAQFCTLEKKA